MKGIILAGGKGTRLEPLTSVFNKHLLPIYDKPMIYYPLSVLMLSGIRDILIIVNDNDLDFYKKLLSNGESYGINISYEIQKKPEGIAQSFIIGKNFIGSDNVCLILGDNIFFGYKFSDLLADAMNLKEGAIVFSNFVKNPKDFAIAEFDKNGKIVSLEEKPKNPKSNHAVTGLYFYDNDVVKIAEKLKPSARGELEITDINKVYLNKGLLKAHNLGRGFAWLDTGTHESLLEAGDFVRTIEQRQGLKIACLEEIAFNLGWIDESILMKQIEKFNNSPYSNYLKILLK
tara:strand:- start:4412 stop:5275 length:864 start_codon:yes stop_codon:yes gene_type:complete